MTSVAPPRAAPAPVPTAPVAPSRARYVEHLAMAAVLVFWAIPFTRAIGGRGVHTELVFALLLLPVLALARVWRAPTGTLVLAGVVAVAAICVPLVTPTGWYGTDVAAGYVLSASVFVIARCYVRSSSRVAAVAAAVCLAGLYQFSESFLAWWGSRSAATEMSGTFYWHNPYAAFLLPGALIGMAFAAQGRAPWRLVGWVCTPFCCAGIVFSSSRATLATLVVGLLVMLGLTLRDRRMWWRAVGVAALSVAVTFALPGPPFFPHYTSPFAAISARSAAGQSLAQNGAYRTEFWREAVQVALHHPLAGAGYHSLATASALYTPSGWARSQLAHDGYLQPLSDGGLLLGVPFLLAMAVIAFWALRRSWRAFRRDDNGSLPDIVVTGAAVALLGALAHSAVDFDWTHPAIMVEAALLAACVAPWPATRHRRRGHRVLAGTVVAALLAVLTVCGFALHQWQVDQPNLDDSPATLLAHADAPFGDYRPAVDVLLDATQATHPVSADQVRQALSVTRSEASIDLHLALLRDAAAALVGADPDAVVHAEASLSQVRGSTSPYAPDLATVMLAEKETGAAKAVLSKDIAAQQRKGAADPNLFGEVVLWAQAIGRGPAYACERAIAVPLLGSAAALNLPATHAACGR